MTVVLPRLTPRCFLYRWVTWGVIHPGSTPRCWGSSLAEWALSFSNNLCIARRARRSYRPCFGVAGMSWTHVTGGGGKEKICGLVRLRSGKRGFSLLRRVRDSETYHRPQRTRFLGHPSMPPLYRSPLRSRLSWRTLRVGTFRSRIFGAGVHDSVDKIYWAEREH